jgi:outer membrane protein assembly factor BamA
MALAVFAQPINLQVETRKMSKLLRLAKLGCWGLLLTSLFPACIGTRYLTGSEHLLYNQNIKGNRAIPAEELEAFYRQKPNRKLFFFAFSPYLVAYYEGKKRYDPKLPEKKTELKYVEAAYAARLADSTLTQNQTRKLLAKREREVGRLRQWIEEGNWLMRSVGEKPVIFDSIVMKKTAEQMEFYLRQKGFYRATVQPSYQLQNRTANVLYVVVEGPARFVRSFAQASPDSAVAQLLWADSANALVKRGQRYDETAFARERDRLTRLLRDNGYYDFAKEFVFFDIDTLAAPAQADVRVVVEPPAPRLPHRLFRVTDINVITDEGVESERAARDTAYYPTRNGVKFISFGRIPNTPYKNRVLYERIRFQKGRPFSQTEVEDTQRALASMDMFRFVNLRFDTLGGRFETNIFASPLPAYDFSVESGLNVAQALPGPFFSVALKNRNTFNAYEIFELRARGAIESQGSAIQQTNAYNARELSLNGSLVFPRLLLPVSAQWKRRVGINSPRTRVNSGFTYIRRPEYDRLNFQASWGYEWANRRRNKTYTANLLDLNLVNTPRFEDSFILYLIELAAGGNTLLRSFSRLIVSSISFNYLYYDPKRPDAFYFRAFAESGGTTLNLLSNRTLAENPTLFGLEYFRFLKVNTEFRYYIPQGKTSTWAFRANLGLARPYGNLGDVRNTVLPYEKYFFTGGSNSIRAWRPRRLGPGSYSPINAEGRIDERFERPGEMLLELNAEYRTKLLGFVNGAFFVDAGNVWMLTADSRPNSQFRFDRFYNEIAVGTGLGLRLDFSFVIMRFDVGVRVWDPVLPLPQRFVLGNFRYAPPAFNLGIGYPF